MLSQSEATIPEKTMPTYYAQLTREVLRRGRKVKENIALADISAITLTYYDHAGGSAINSRNGQNVLNQNNVTINEFGLLKWDMQEADTVIVGGTVAEGGLEKHIALFEFTLTAAWGSKKGKHEAVFYIKQLTKVT